MSWRDKVLGVGVGYAVGGPAGAAVGLALTGGDDDPGFDLSDVPFGVHVEVAYDDDAEGRRWTLRFLSAITGDALAVVRVLDDAACPIAGRPPFADDQGQFVAFAPIDRRRASLFVPWDALDYASADHLSLEISVWGNAGGRPSPSGKAVVDAELPPR